MEKIIQKVNFQMNFNTILHMVYTNLAYIANKRSKYNYIFMLTILNNV